MAPSPSHGIEEVLAEFYELQATRYKSQATRKELQATRKKLLYPALLPCDHEVRPLRLLRARNVSACLTIVAAPWHDRPFLSRCCRVEL